MGQGNPEQQQGSAAVAAAWAELDQARATYHEEPSAAMAVALRAERVGSEQADPALRGRALALQTLVTVHGGGLRAGFALAAGAEVAAEAAQHPVTTVEVAAMGAHLAFFSGSYREALAHAERCVATADGTGDVALRIFARRQSCMVFGNLDAPEWPRRLDEILALTVGAGDRWEEALSRNDLAHFRMTQGDDAEARAEIARAIAVAEALAPRHHFALGVLLCTRAEIHLAGGRPEAALEDARDSLARVVRVGEPNPYIFGMAVCVEVRALLALDRVDEAGAAGRAGVARLHRTVPQIRAMILMDVAAALREAGRAEEAYDALLEATELERLASRELTELHRDFQRAVAAQGQLREQAERDWLTGLFNRRYLAGVLERAEPEGELAVAALDLDHFKAINDRFGHDVGDRVLARAAQVLQRTVRAGDVVARTGGEEFMVVMAATGPVEARACAERLRAAIAAESWDDLAPGLTITASIGVVSAAGTAPDDLVRLADRRLYAAKSAGRNRVDAAAA